MSNERSKERRKKTCIQNDDDDNENNNNNDDVEENINIFSSAGRYYVNTSCTHSLEN